MTVHNLPTPRDLSADEARSLTDRIKLDAGQLWDKIVIAYQGRAHTALGYASWDEYCATEFRSVLQLWLPREDRTGVLSLRGGAVRPGNRIRDGNLPQHPDTRQAPAVRWCQ